MVLNVLQVLFGGFLGGISRYGLLKFFPRRTALFIANVTASFILGVFSHSLFFGIGFAGALSTWATLAADVAEDFRGRYLDVVITIPAVLLAAGIGLAL